MIQWKTLPAKEIELFESLGGPCFVAAVIKSTGFDKCAMSKERDLNNYTQEVRHCIHEMIPYYEEMRKLKLSL